MNKKGNEMMVIVMNEKSNQLERESVIEKVKRLGLKVHVSQGENTFLIGLIGDTSKVPKDSIEAMIGVEKVLHIKETYKLASRSFKGQDMIIDVNGVNIGGEEVVMMAGPCSVESREQIVETAEAVQKAGAKFLRGGAFKPRTSPYGFQGLGEQALKWMKEAKEITGLNLITEVTSEEVLDLVEQYVDIIQIGARNVQNFKLLRAVGKTNKPILLKRGMATTIDEWLNSAEYIMNEGNHKVILCERGIRTFETATRNTLDISAVPVLKRLTHLPVIIDPSHAAGKSYYVGALSKAGIAAGADGVIIEVHPNPKEALSDAAQQLTFDEFDKLSSELKNITLAVGRKM
jgi:3-deoxy-7-phosphoheptulonate synthase